MTQAPTVQERLYLFACQQYEQERKPIYLGQLTHFVQIALGVHIKDATQVVHQAVQDGVLKEVDGNLFLPITSTRRASKTETELVVITAAGPIASLADVQQVFGICASCAPKFALFVEDEGLLAVPCVKAALANAMEEANAALDAQANRMGLEESRGEVLVCVQGQVGKFTQFTFSRQHPTKR